jgi:hypothetical protein
LLIHRYEENYSKDTQSQRTDRSITYSIYVNAHDAPISIYIINDALIDAAIAIGLTPFSLTNK